MTKTPAGPPPLPLSEWYDAKVTLHLFAQIVGKVRMQLMPARNHWWHVPLYVSVRGLTTRPIPLGMRAVQIDFDFFEHEVSIRDTRGAVVTIPLRNGLTVADFFRQIMEGLRQLDVTVSIVGRPYEVPQSTTAFAQDTTHAGYDPTYVRRYWDVLVWINGIMEEFAGRFLGKSTPVHLFWHSFDLALTRFSGRRAPAAEGANRVNRDAYSHEVVSFGFWAGDDVLGGPALYSYTHPLPDGLSDQTLHPVPARWGMDYGSPMALLMYDDLRVLPDPRAGALDFFESAYRAGARLAGWDVEDLAYRGPDVS